MNKDALLKLNCIPEGQPAWLKYREFRKLRKLFDALPSPLAGDSLHDGSYVRLHQFLGETAGIEVPENEEAVHLNAFVLIRRGYQVEEITPAEYAKLKGLLESAGEVHMDDVELHDFGDHRLLYKFLTEELGVYVEPGRGPVWQRARQLVDHFEASNPTN